MTQETNDVVTQLRAKAAWHEFCAADKWDFEEAANLIQFQSARIAELEGALRLWLEYDDQDEADFARAGPMLLYARALDASRTALENDNAKP